MRKVGILVFSFLVFLSSTSLVLDLLSFNISFAQEITPTPVPQSNYELPYPGLLPDSPLYIFRVTRDKIINLLISAPLKKAEFNLLQADKRLNAGIYLVNKNKIPLAITTISKAENYFDQALKSIEEARKEGMNIGEIAGRLMDSSRKHQEVLMSLEEKAPKNFKTDFNFQQKRVIQFQKEINSITTRT